MIKILGIRLFTLEYGERSVIRRKRTFGTNLEHKDNANGRNLPENSVFHDKLLPEAVQMQVECHKPPRIDARPGYVHIYGKLGSVAMACEHGWVTLCAPIRVRLS